MCGIGVALWSSPSSTALPERSASTPKPAGIPKAALRRRGPDAQAPQHGQRAAVSAPQLSSCASSGRAWWLWAALHSQEEADPLARTRRRSSSWVTCRRRASSCTSRRRCCTCAVTRAGRSRCSPTPATRCFGTARSSAEVSRSARQHGQSARLKVPKVGCRASSGRAWRLWAARDTQGERLGHWHPATASSARASRLQSRRFYRR